MLDSVQPKDCSPWYTRGKRILTDGVGNLTVSTVHAGELPLHLVWGGMALVLMAVTCSHPETVFRDQAEKFGLLIDAAIELAVALAGFEDLEVDHS
jgi:hypothetical protein